MKRSKELTRHWLKGGITGLCLLLLLTLLGAVLLSTEVIPEKGMGIVRGCILGISVFFAGLLSLRGANAGALPVTMGIAAVILCITVCLHLALAGDAPWHLWSIPIAFAAALLSALLGAGRKRRY